MSINASLYSRATSHAGLSALIGTRFFPKRLEQDCSFPAIRYVRVSTPDEGYNVHSSSVGTAMANRWKHRYQLDGYADTPDGAEALKLQMYDAFNGYSGGDVGYIFVKNFIDGDDLELNKHRIIMEIVIDHKF